MSPQLLQFVLVPDGSSALRVRGLLSQGGARSGIVVGTWPELLLKARDACLVDPPDPAAAAGFEEALGSLEAAFWSESHAVAPHETAGVLRDEVTALLAATDPQQEPDALPLDRLSEGPQRIVRDVLRLAASLRGRLPGDLETTLKILRTDPEGVRQPIRVQRIPGVPHTTRWQDALIATLNAASGTARGAVDDELQAVLEASLGQPPAAAQGSALRRVQERLFQQDAEPAAYDGTMQWVGVSDSLQEAEVAAGMAQTLLGEDPELRPAEIGLLMPASSEYRLAVHDAFGLAGLAVSGLPAESRRRNLGAETVRNFLYCRQKPTPGMALAACVSSVLMPWSEADGARLAHRVMQGSHDLAPPKGADDPSRAVLQLLRNGDSEPLTLAAGLRSFASNLNGAEEVDDHRREAEEAVERVLEKLAGATAIDWASLRRAAGDSYAVGGARPVYTVEGVTIWRERHEPWRPVRHLLVLGFCEGRYPGKARVSPVLSADDAREIRDRLDLALDDPADALHRSRQLLLRQLRAASDSVTFLIPRRTAHGQRQFPSRTLMFMERLVAEPVAGKGLITELEAPGDWERIRNLALASAEEVRQPRELVRKDLDLGRNLLELRVKPDGSVRPESPSSLDLLMFSPLAWILRALHAEPSEWSPDAAGSLARGKLAHSVFEGLFARGGPLPDPDSIERLVGEALKAAVQREAPFLLSSFWSVERGALASQQSRAAAKWREVLGRLNAEVLASEQWLEGTWKGIAVHGKADLILDLGEGDLLIVDYKWQRSDRRVGVMEKGFDNQSSLYRLMAQLGGIKSPESGSVLTDWEKRLAAKLRNARSIGVAYYTMRDGVCLSDVAPPRSEAIPDWQAFGWRVAESAFAIIEAGLDGLREGHVPLNCKGDKAYFETRSGAKPYAMDLSPLIDLFSVPAELEAPPHRWEKAIEQSEAEEEQFANADDLPENPSDLEMLEQITGPETPRPQSKDRYGRDSAVEEQSEAGRLGLGRDS